MNPEDQNYGAGAEAAHQANDVQTQMSIEEEAAKPPVEEVDNSIIAGIEAEEDMKPLSDVIHEGATQPDPTPTDFASEPAVPVKEKKPGSKKPFIIGIIAVVVLATAGFGIWALMSAGGSDNGGAKPDPDRLAFFVEGDNGNTSYAIYNDKGEKLTDFSYEKLSDFNASGYAVVKKVGTEKPAIMTNIGKYSIAPGEYSDIEAFGGNFIVKGEEGNEILIDGSGKKILSIELRTSNIGLYSFFDGSISHIYDKDGTKIGESGDKKPLSSAVVNNNTVCFTYDKKVRCYNAKTGDKVNEFESEEPLTLYLNSGSVSKNYQCMRLESTDPAKDNLYLYYYGKLSVVEGKRGGLNVTEKSGSNYCYFTDHEYIYGADGKAVPMPENSDSASLVIQDSEHYMYFTTSKDRKYFSLYLHADGKERALVENTTWVPEIDGSGSHYIAYYKGENDSSYVLEYYADGLEPLYSKTAGIMGTSFSSPIDENGNFIADRGIYNKDKDKPVYSIPYEVGTSSIFYEDGYYFVKGYVLDDETKNLILVDKNGKEVIKYGRYDTFKKYGKMLVGKKNDSYSLLDINGKVLLENYDSIQITESHIEALKDGKTEYYLLDMTKVK